MDDTVAALGKGSRVWYRQDPATWLLAEIKDNSNGSPVLQLITGSPGKTLTVDTSQLVPANPELQQAIADLTQLSYLNEPSILENLGCRYKLDNIYTNAGPVLIAVNPCKNLPLYTADVADEYKAGAFEAVNQLSPHIYLVAGAAFRDMVRQGTSQSLVINGESGAGKTETTKKAMQFFAALAGGTGVEGQVLETNPILEAFGNAKTLRNHNSSRFGKLIEIHFNKTNHICGARIRTYLLEKSRVVHQLKGERSYHIFYQLVRGTQDKAQREALRLPAKPTDFAYLAKSGCTDIDGVDDAANFVEVLEALADIGLTPPDINALLATLSGILWLGNLKIEPQHADDSSRVKGDAALANAAALLGLQDKDLAHAITHKKIKTRDELIVKPLTAQEAVEARDALAKALYAGVFTWIVGAINAKLDMGKKASGRFIAILDIYGFEQFTTNSFEQLCINYANERLQQQFTRHLFTLEQEEYEAEGIDWTKVEWVDNQACVDVIEAMPPKGLGVLAVLDSQCKFPKGSDETFMHALRDSLAENDHFGTNPRKQDEFFITHYAGPVSYNSAGFLDKNKDMLNTDIVELMESSSAALIVSIGATTAEEMEGRRGGQTVSSRFTQQLKELVSMLDATGLHFVRCIKPNAALSAGTFATDLVLQQLRCCGVLEVARVSRAGFPTRYRHADFVQRYKILLLREQQGLVLSSDAETRAAVAKLLAVFKVPAGQFEMGRTKVFFKPGVLGYVEDTWAKMQSSVLQLQAFTRMSFARRRYLEKRRAAILLQSSWVARVARLKYAQELKQHKAAVTIQRHYKGHVARQQYIQTRRAITVFQAAERRRQLNKRVAARVQARLAREAAEAAAEAARREAEEGFEALKGQYGITELSEVRSALACYAALKGELDSRDPEEVQEALGLLATVRATAGPGGKQLSREALGEALGLQALCHQQLGSCDSTKVQQALAAAAAVKGHDSQQLEQALAVADICKAELGVGYSEQQLQEALAAAAVCQQALGSCNGLEVQQALSAAAVCKAELGVGYSEQQLQEALAAAAVCQQELGSCNGLEVQQALSAAAVCKAELGVGYSEQQLQEALAAAAVCQQELGSCNGPEVQQALSAAAVCKAELGVGYSEQQLQEALAAAAVCQQELGSCNGLEVQQALSAAAVCKAELGVGYSEQQLRDALAAAAVCQQELGSCNGLEVQQALSAAAVCKAELGVGYSEQRLREALAAAAVCQQELGGYDVQQLQQSLAVAAVTRHQLGAADPQRVREVLQLGEVCHQAGVQQASQLQQQLRLGAAAAAAASPEEVCEALALQRSVEQAAGLVSPSQVTAALKLQAAAEDEGITDAAGLAAALAAAAAAATAVAMASAASGNRQSTSSGEDEEARSLGAVVVAQGVTDPQELQVALSTYRHLRRDGHAFDPKNARRACSMYAAAMTHGIADKRDFMAAAALYGVLREDGITSAGELRLAVAMYGAVREEGILDPDDLHSAIELANIARDEGLAQPEELRSVLAASRGGYSYAGAAGANGNAAAAAAGAGVYVQPDRLGSLRLTGGAAAPEGSSEGVLQQQVAALQHQLESEKAARSKYAKQLEQQAVEWMGQVKLLKEYIDSLRAKMPSHTSAGGMPSLQLPLSPGAGGGAGGGKGSGAGAQAKQLVASLEGDWSAKAPLFDDDAAFIREVVDGEVLAPDMQVQAELDRLRQKYEAWNKQFKSRMREVQAALRKGGHPTGVLATLNSLGSMSSPTAVSVPGGGGGGGGRAASISSIDSAAAGVDLKRMPDLTAPDLLGAEDRLEAGGGGERASGGGAKKKKGLFKGLLR